MKLALRSSLLNDITKSCADLITASKNNHFKKLGHRLNDPLLAPKAYWSILNNFLGKKKIPLIPPILHNETFVTDF